MSISIRQLTGAVIVSFCAGTLITPVFTQGQATMTAAAPAQPSFMLVEFMKVEDGKEAEWIKLESETWKPMHALRVKNGSIQSWSAISQWVPGDAPHGGTRATVTTFRGFPDPTNLNFEALFKQAHPQGDMDAVSRQTQAARSIVRSEIWQVLDQTTPTAMTSR